jgi:hypothetical protein
MEYEQAGMIFEQIAMSGHHSQMYKTTLLSFESQPFTSAGMPR